MGTPSKENLHPEVPCQEHKIVPFNKAGIKIKSMQTVSIVGHH